MIAREIKRQKTVERFAAKRAELKKIIADSQSSEEDKFTAREKLQKLPRDANPIRLQRRCQITGRPHAVYRKFGLSRNKLREGMPIGCKVTLRKEKMYDFFEKLIKISLPRVRDFRGLSQKSFDGRGNYTLGIKEHIIFPEIDFDRIDKIKGLDITITTTAKNDQEALELFKQFNFPFK